MSSNLRKRRSASPINSRKSRRRKPNPSGLGNANVQIDHFVDQNTSLHHTSDYENDALVLRRGGRFKLGMTFEGVKFSDILGTVLRFSIEPRPKSSDKIFKSCRIEKALDNLKWSMVIVEKDPNLLKLVVEINIPVDVSIGRHSLEVIVPSISSTPLEESEIIILFNPWNKDDDVYLDKADLRQEYVLSDTGLVYRGSSSYGPWGIDGKPWNFGQFEENILDCVLLLLEKDKRAKRNLKTLARRKSPVWVARYLSAVLNSQDENGVLEGNWTGDYEDGNSPSSWNGSVEILQEYFATEKPVKYGQCWVFSGIMTTALRALGIPARSVTNFDSAHDTDQTMTIDSFIDEDGDRVDDLNNDSIWNFHVWNEIWTKRPDLPDHDYDGWQAVDSTPQEESCGLSQMGPAPLKAVKKGEVYAGFDTGFVFGEVNADYVKWLVKKDENDEYVVQKSTYQNTRHVGKYISTKKVGRDEREDITHLYKHPEGSTEERKAFDTAYSFGKGPENWAGELNMEEEGKDLTIDLSTKPNKVIPNGDSFTCMINVKNTSQKKLTVNLTGVISSIQYTGEVKMLVKREKMGDFVIDAGKNISREIHVKPEDYLGKLTDLNCLKLVVVAKVQSTGKHYVDDITFQLSNKDCIKIEFLQSPAKLGQRCNVVVTFTNPLPIALSRLKFTIEGAGLLKPIKRFYRRKLKSGGMKKVKFHITPKKAGVRTLMVDVDSTQAKDFKASANVKVVN